MFVVAGCHLSLRPCRLYDERNSVFKETRDSNT